MYITTPMATTTRTEIETEEHPTYNLHQVFENVPAETQAHSDVTEDHEEPPSAVRERERRELEGDMGGQSLSSDQRNLEELQQQLDAANHCNQQLWQELKDQQGIPTWR